jgi:hypothetical protein
MEAPLTPRAVDPAQKVLGSEPEHLNSGQYKAINGCTDSDGQLMSVPLLIESYPETTVYVDSNQYVRDKRACGPYCCTEEEC